MHPTTGLRLAPYSGSLALWQVAEEKQNRQNDREVDLGRWR